MGAGDKVITGQGMANQHGVGLFRIQLAIGLIGDVDVLQINAAIKAHRLVMGQRHLKPMGLGLFVRGFFIVRFSHYLEKSLIQQYQLRPIAKNQAA
jgi:hypothetical protein